MVNRDAALGVLDAHCHVDLYRDPEGIVARAEAAGIRTIAVTNAPSVFFHTAMLTEHSRFVRPALGLHPELVASHGHEIDQFWAQFEKTRYIGEIGLDYVTQDSSLREEQRRIFSAIVARCHASGDKVLSIHSRRAVDDVLSIIGNRFLGTAILHWFTGSPKQAERAAAQRFYFSVNPAMVRSKSGAKLIQSIPRDRVLTETDGPFVKIGERPAEPTDTGEVVLYLAQIWQVSTSDARALVLHNLKQALVTKE